MLSTLGSVASQGGKIDKYIYMTDDNNNIRKIEIKTGNQIWQKTISSYITDLAVTETHLYVASNGGLYCYKVDGTLEWHKTNYGSIYAVEVSNTGYIYISANADYIYALHSNGNKFTEEFCDYLGRHIVIDSSDYVYVATDDDSAVVKYGSTLDELWRRSEHRSFGGMVYKDYVYYGTSDGYIKKLTTNNSLSEVFHITTGGIYVFSINASNQFCFNSGDKTVLMRTLSNGVLGSTTFLYPISSITSGIGDDFFVSTEGGSIYKVKTNGQKTLIKNLYVRISHIKTSQK